MSGHPLHGVKPESEKIRVRCAWKTKTKFFKLLVRRPGEKSWMKVADGFTRLNALEAEYKGKGFETLLQEM